MLNSSDVNIKRKEHRIIAKILAIFWILLIVFTISTILFFEAGWFRKPILQGIISLVNTSLKGKIELQDIHFYTLNGVKLENIKVFAANDNVISVKTIYVNINVITLINKKININKIQIENADIRLLRHKNGIWNIAELVYPKEKDTTETKIKLAVKELIVKGSSFQLYDSTQTPYTHNAIDYTHVTYSNLEFRGSAEYSPNFIKSQVQYLRGLENKTKLYLKDFSGTFTADEHKVRAEKAKIVTALTDIDLNAEYRFNIFSKTPLIIDNKYMVAEVKFNKCDFSDVKKVAPIKNFNVLRNNEGSIRVRGSLNNLYVYYCNVKNGSVEVNLSNIRLKNLMDINKFSYKANLEGDVNQLYAEKIFNFMDFTKLPKLNNFNVTKSYVYGTLDSVYSILNIKSDNGDISFRGGLKFNPIKNYIASIQTKNINLNKILNKPNISENLNLNLYAKGNTDDFKNASIFFKLKLEESELYNVKLKKSTIFFTSLDGNYSFDTISINAINNKGGLMNLNLNGKLLFNGGLEPTYNINTSINNFDIAYLTKNNALPNALTCTINLDGKGLNIDSMNTKSKIKIEELTFSDKSLFPFDIDIEIGDLAVGGRYASLKSEFIDVFLNGNYKLTELSKQINIFSGELAKSFANYTDKLIPGNYQSINDEKRSVPLPTLNCSLNANIKDIGAFSTFWAGSRVELQSNLKLDLFSNPQQSKINISEFSINNLVFDNRKNRFDISKISIFSNVGFSYRDSLYQLDALNLKLNIPNQIIINKENYQLPYLNIGLNDKQIDLSTAVGYSNKLALNLKTSLITSEKSIVMQTDTLKLDFRNGFLLKNLEPIIAEADEKNIIIENCQLASSNGTTLNIFGALRDSVLDNFQIELKNFNALNLNRFYPEKNKKLLESIQLTLNKLIINCNGNISNPSVNLNALTDEITFDKKALGKLNLFANYFDKKLKGNVRVLDKNNEPNLELRLNKLELSEKKPEYNLDFVADSFALEPFIFLAEPLYSLKAFLFCNINLSSTKDEGAVLKGNLSINDAYYHLRQTNMKYISDVNLNFEDKVININRLDVRNYDTKGVKGNANLSGMLFYDKYLNIDSINIDLNAKKLKILGDETKETMQQFYGDIALSTDEILNIAGEFDKLRFKGGIALNQAVANFPLLSGGKNAESKLEYEYYTEKKVVIAQPRNIKSEQDSIENTKKLKATKKRINIFKNYSFDVTFDIQGKGSISMDLGPVGEIYAEVNERDNKKIRYFKKPGDEYGQINGKLVLSDKSKLNTFKTLNVSGDISFPTGSPLEPKLNIQARYKGITTIGAVRKDYEVVIELQGPPNNLQSNIYYYIEGDKASGDKADIQEKALFLLLTGQFKSSSSTDNQQQSNLIAEGGSALLSAFASRTLTDLLASGFISNAGIDFKGSSFDEPTIKFQGQLPGDINWSLGGDLADLNGSREIIIEVPIRALIDNNYFKNVFLKASWNELSQKTRIKNDDTDWQIMINFNKSW